MRLTYPFPADLTIMVTYPPLPGQIKHRQATEALLRSAGGEPAAGRHLISWALKAGFQRSHITAKGNMEMWSSPEERVFYGASALARWETTMGPTCIKKGIMTEEQLQEVLRDWRKWIDIEDAVYSVPQTEIICRKET